MQNTNNPTAPPCRIGLISDVGALPALAPLMLRPSIRFTGQSGMKQGEALPGATWYDDTRVMIAQGGLDAVVLHTSPRIAADMSRVALEHGLHVWRNAPIGRRFNEAVAFAATVRSAERISRVASWWEHIATDVKWAEALAPGFRPTLTELRISAAAPLLQDWRANANDAGGGVLMTDCYAAIEALLALRGFPQRVLATIGQCRRKPGQPPRENEDVAIAVLNYADGGIAVIEAFWDVPPTGWLMAHHAAEATLELEQGAVRMRHADGSVLDQRSLPSPADILSNEFSGFEAAIAATREKTRSTPAAMASDAPPEARTTAAAQAPRQGSFERHLAVVALIETIYLAARTGQPERPGKLYEVQGWPEPAL